MKPILDPKRDLVLEMSTILCKPQELCLGGRVMQLQHVPIWIKPIRSSQFPICEV